MHSSTTRRLRQFTLRSVLFAFTAFALALSIVHFVQSMTRPRAVVITDIAIRPGGSEVAIATTFSNPSAFTRLRRGDISVGSSQAVADSLTLRVFIVGSLDGELLGTKVQTSGEARSLTWSYDGSHLAMISGRLGTTSDGKTLFQGVDVCELATGDVSQLLPPRCKSPRFCQKTSMLGAIHNQSLIVVGDAFSGSRYNSPICRINTTNGNWCWHPDRTTIFFVNPNSELCEYQIDNDIQRVLIASDSAHPGQISHIISSPTGEQLGFYSNGRFNVVDRITGDVVAGFECASYFLEFDWNDTGICFLNQVSTFDTQFANLQLYTPRDDSIRTVATGHFALPRWLNEAEILVRQNNTAIRSFDVTDGSTRVIVDLSSLEGEGEI